MGFLRPTILSLFAVCIILPAISQNNEDYEYERSSLHSMMIKHLNDKFGDIIEDVYLCSPFPERFNDHNLGVKTISFAEGEGDMRWNIEAFARQVNLGQKMVAKWFNRDKTTGSFNCELIKSRGLYNASQAQVNIARSSLRGMSLLEDAGENLIKHTYLIVNDIKYTSESEGSMWLKTIADVYTFRSSAITEVMTSIGGFNVEITSYLFRLDWNDEKAYQFYNEYYTEDGNSDTQKVAAFKADKTLFSMTYIGKTHSVASEKHFSKSKDVKALLIKVCTRALDQGIAQLQHSYPEFRIKAPLFSTEPLKAHIGLKEDITEDSRFEVLERIIDADGKLSYNRVGIIKPKKNAIWDNRFGADEDNDSQSELTATEFLKVSGGDFYPGMLIREIN